MSFDHDEFLKQLSTLTVAELVQLTKALEASWGVTATPVGVTPPPIVDPPPDPIGDPTIFTVVLKNAGANRIGVVRVVRELTGLGLVAARDLVDAAPKEVQTGLNLAEANHVAAKLREAGAEVELK